MTTPLIQPVLKDEAFIADVLSRKADQRHLHLWWLGQSGFLIQWQGRHLLADPYLSDSLSKKYAASARPHVRMTARIAAPEKLDFIDVVTSSHSHTDHLDSETLQSILRANPKVELIIPEANRPIVSERANVMAELPKGLDDHKVTSAAGFRIHGVPAAHPTLEKDEWGRHRFLGYVIVCGPWTIYHSGDTLRYDGLVERLAEWPITVALLPINGDVPERGVAGNLNGTEAATLAKQLGTRVVIPCHFEMFEFNTASPAEFVAASERLGQPYRVLRCGEHWSTEELS